jgi:hypothetical protein
MSTVGITASNTLLVKHVNVYVTSRSAALSSANVADAQQGMNLTGSGVLFLSR